MTTTSPSTSAKLDDRYGRTRGRRVGRWIVGGILAAVLVGYLSWVTIAGAMDAVDVDTTAFEVHDARSVTVHFQVTLQPGRPFACVVEAQDTEHGVVGWRVVEYPADAAHTRAFSETIPTTAEATTGLVSSCWIP